MKTIISISKKLNNVELEILLIRKNTSWCDLLKSKKKKVAISVGVIFPLRERVIESSGVTAHGRVRLNRRPKGQPSGKRTLALFPLNYHHG